jgi:hypothetical protein
MSDERWIIVPDFPGYRVSDAGRVQTRKLRGGNGRRDLMGPDWLDMSPGVHKRGHLSIGLRHGGRVVRRYVHELVLTLFVGPCPPGLEACHENDTPGDNRLGNLRWDTHASNGRDASRNGRMKGNRKSRGEANPNCKVTATACDEIRRDRAAGVKLKVLAVRHGISEQHVSRIFRGTCRA